MGQLSASANVNGRYHSGKEFSRFFQVTLRIELFGAEYMDAPLAPNLETKDI